MEWPRVRFTLRTMMIAVAIAAGVFALISARWNRSSIVDPFDSIEMIGHGPETSDKRNRPPAGDPFDSVEMADNAGTPSSGAIGGAVRAGR
jgi:hypothetical protein